jgi:hypothetical protein
MALTGKEIVRVTGLINNGLAATYESVTTQNIANLNTTSAVSPTAPLTGLETVACFGPSGAGIPSAVSFLTTTQAICSLGSIAPSTLVGTEIVHIGGAVIGQSQTANRQTATTLAIAG